MIPFIMGLLVGAVGTWLYLTQNSGKEITFKLPTFGNKQSDDSPESADDNKKVQ